MRITDAQLRALRWVAVESRDVDALADGIGLLSLRALIRRGLVSLDCVGWGWPTPRQMWSSTLAGHAYLAGLAHGESLARRERNDDAAAADAALRRKR